MMRTLEGDIRIDDRPPQHVLLSNLTTSTVFVHTKEALEFQRRISLLLDGVILDGSVVYVDSPKGAVVAFSPNRPARSALHRLLSGGDPEIASALSRPASVPSTDVEHATLDTLGDESSRSLVAPGLAAAADLDDEGRTEELEMTPKGLAAAKATTKAPQVVTAVHRGEPCDEAAAPIGSQAAPIDSRIPSLHGDVVSFETAAQFQTQFKSSMLHGAIVAKGPALPLGTQRVVRLSVAGVRQTLRLSGVVRFLGEGTVGLMIESFSVVKPELRLFASIVG